MNFELDSCLIRPATKADRDDLISVSKGIWGGTDYLPKVMDRWISEPWFLVCEYQGHVIACLKLSLFPDQVLWFEGLRVRSRYQNRGVATLMNRHSFALAHDLRRAGKVRSFEFCTYYLNKESLHLTQKLGFKVVATFWQLNKRGIKATREPKLLPRVDLKAFRHYGKYIPCAWQSLHHCPGRAALPEPPRPALPNPARHLLPRRRPRTPPHAAGSPHPGHQRGPSLFPALLRQPQKLRDHRAACLQGLPTPAAKPWLPLLGTRGGGKHAHPEDVVFPVLGSQVP